MIKDLTAHQTAVYSMVNGLLKSKFFQDEPIPGNVDRAVKHIIITNQTYHFISRVLLIDDNDSERLSKFTAILKEAIVIIEHNHREHL